MLDGKAEQGVALRRCSFSLWHIETGGQVSTIEKDGSDSGEARTTSRREFIKDLGFAAAAVGAFGAGAGKLLAETDKGAGEKTAAKLLPRRTLGRSAAKISIIAGNESMRGAVQARALELGVNYWHKFNHCKPPEFELIKKHGREKHYLEACIDPKESVDANVDRLHRAIDKMGVDYIDFYKIHAVDNWSAGAYEAAKEAYHKVKEEGRVKHLCASFHKYDAARRTLEQDDLEAIQIMFNPLSPRAAREVIGLAKQKNVGVIAMKPMAGGGKKWEGNEKLHAAVKEYLPDNRSIAQAIIKWSLLVPGVTAVAPACFNLQHLEENLGAALQPRLTERERLGLQAFAGALSTDYCRSCGLCEEHCPRGIAVSDILRYEMYYRAYEQPGRARKLYRELPSERRAEACDGCGECDRHCPYGLAVAGKLAEAREILA